MGVRLPPGAQGMGSRSDSRRTGILNSTAKLAYNTNFGRIGSWGFPARLPDSSQAGGKSLWVHTKRGPVPTFGRNGILNSTTKLVYNTNFGRIGSWGFPARLPDGSQAGGGSLQAHQALEIVDWDFP